MKLDLLVLVAHPDDAELGCSGTIVSHIKQGKKVGVIDYTQGELGTRGTAETRKTEAAEASKIMGLSVRENLKFRDGFYQNDENHQLEVIKVIRKYRPEIIITNAITDRHPDHPKGAELTIDSVFKSGLKKIETTIDGKLQEVWRPSKVFHIVQSRYIEPDFVIDITDSWEEKLQSIYAYKTQFHIDGTDNSGDQTFISTPDFIYLIEARAREYGKSIGVQYGEGFTKAQQLGITDLFTYI